MENKLIAKTTGSKTYVLNFLFSFFIKNIALLYFCLSALLTYAQEDKHPEEPFGRHHGVSLMLSHTHTGQGTEDGKKKWLALPSWALDYNYFFSRKWSLGLHNDLIVETFKVKEHETNQEVIERTRPVASVGVVSFKPGRHFSFQFGAGGEFAKEGSYFLNRLGVEYSLELPQRWELISTVTSDLKWHAYNSVSFGIGISKAFGFSKK